MGSALIWFAMLLMKGNSLAVQERSTPEATVSSFMAAYARADMKAANTYIKESTADAAALNLIAGLVKSIPVSVVLTDLKSVLDGSSATVSGSTKTKFGKSGNSRTSDFTVRLDRVEGAWKIVPDHEKALLRYNPDIVNEFAYRLKYPAETLRGREMAGANTCHSNVYVLDLCVMALIDDNHDMLKLKAQTFEKSLTPYNVNIFHGNKDVFGCPLDKKGAHSYSFNGNLAGINIKKIRIPAATVVIYEGRDGKLDFRHHGEAAVGFADGQAKFVGAEEAKTLRWKP